MSIDYANWDEMIRYMSLRPLMYCSGIKTGRDLIFFLLGASKGARLTPTTRPTPTTAP